MKFILIDAVCFGYLMPTLNLYFWFLPNFAIIEVRKQEILNYWGNLEFDLIETELLSL